MLLKNGTGSKLLLAAFLALTLSCRKTQDLGPPKTVAVREDGLLELQVASFNIRYAHQEDDPRNNWPHRIAKVVHIIHDIAPDVFGVQEALHGPAADLWASLPDYEFFGVGREDGKRGGEYSGIFFLRSRFELDQSDCGTFWLSSTPEIPGSMTWGNTLPRTATWVHLTDRATGRGFYFFDSHWDHRNQNSREHAAMLIASRIDQRKFPQDPVILVGDFNAIENNPAVAFLRGERATIDGKKQKWPNGLLDTFNALHPNDPNRRTFHQWESVRRGDFKLDHILVTRNAKVLKSGIQFEEPPFASDHYAVSSRIVFPLGS
ncbi:endonuclease/exonuclease/phosphatase family protein [Luteolibacter pohnpeiensis]|uniref:Endonuclease/exonuclease/phosphatase family protein n=1 Tax=Luteolibacter pohnpeiensis TaxID=454153 RepID=A0A934S8C6_9BACT|nr:endonuclease/exonuclease/phosphatase family protein [Luteolibacter pohnpeiensis]MBK1882706.1 endonuclease/exonuclease/phosphatase family protein [Luteolibacter pohnpeiensis]